MHCRSCEMLVEDEISKVANIKKVEVNYKKRIAEVYYEEKNPSMNEIGEAVRKAGYSIGEEKARSFLSKNPSDYKDFGIAASFLAFIYLIAKSFGFTDINLNIPTTPSNLSVVALIGLTAGFSTCMALVGGLVLGLSARHSEKHPESTKTERFRPYLFFNFGRVIGFAIFGGILGFLGSVIQVSGTLSGYLMVAVGLVMLILGLQLTELFPWLNGIKIMLPKRTCACYRD